MTRGMYPGAAPFLVVALFVVFGCARQHSSLFPFVDVADGAADEDATNDAAPARDGAADGTDGAPGDAPPEAPSPDTNAPEDAPDTGPLPEDTPDAGTCPAGSAPCADGCRDLQSDRSHCGRCGQACSVTEACVSGGCVSSCLAGQVDCGGRCVDARTDPLHCGMCGRACPAGMGCVRGRCEGTCESPLRVCGGSCLDVSSDPLNCGGCDTVCLTGPEAMPVCASGVCGLTCSVGFGNCDGVATNGCEVRLTSDLHCGACGRACPVGQACRMGACARTCAPTETLCGAVCVNTLGDLANCGACGRACTPGQVCAAGSCVAPSAPMDFQVSSLGVGGCRTIDHVGSTGDDRGGIAVSDTSVFYTGDLVTARFDLEPLGGAMSLGRQVDGLVSDLQSGKVYSLGTSATDPVGSTGGSVTHLLELDGRSGAMTSRSVTLSQAVMLSYGRAGVFAGYGRLVLLDGSAAWAVDTTTGLVTSLGAMAIPPHQGCENWAFWGVAEFSAGATSVVYVRDATSVVRARVPEGTVTVLGTFTNLADMCSIAVSPSQGRWYFHHEGASQFGGSDETLGWCPATTLPSFRVCPPGQTVCDGGCVDVGSHPAHCSGCGRACGAGATCVAGSCVTVALRRYVAETAPSAFVDACAAPGRLTYLPLVDDSFATTPLPFEFHFWGERIAAGASVNLCSNGWLGLDGMPNASLSGTLPSPVTPNSVVAVHWGDLLTNGVGLCVALVGSAPSRRWVVEWQSTRNYSTRTGDMTFEAILHEGTNVVEFQYALMSGALSRTAGLENAAGTDGIGACGGSACSPGSFTGVRFRPAL